MRKRALISQTVLGALCVLASIPARSPAQVVVSALEDFAEVLGSQAANTTSIYEPYYFTRVALDVFWMGPGGSVDAHGHPTGFYIGENLDPGQPVDPAQAPFGPGVQAAADGLMAGVCTDGASFFEKHDCPRTGVRWKSSSVAPPGGAGIFKMNATGAHLRSAQ